MSRIEGLGVCGCPSPTASLFRDASWQSHAPPPQRGGAQGELDLGRDLRLERGGGNTWGYDISQESGLDDCDEPAGQRARI